MKTFYTVRDIEDMHAAGVTEIDLHDDVVLTDVAREKAMALGMRLKQLEQAGGSRAGVKPTPAAAGGSSMTPASPTASRLANPTDSAAAATDLVPKIKAAVVARLGTSKYDDLLDIIIPQVMAKLKK